jgi:hypothetical protein
LSEWTLVEEEISLRRCFSIDEDRIVRGCCERGEGLSLQDAIAVFVVSICAGLLLRLTDETAGRVGATAVGVDPNL